MTQNSINNIRNFSIIAHIDHGKSTLADRLLEVTGTIEKRNMQAQVLDTMDLERERGITIKSQAIKMNYAAQDGNNYELNLIDTPGHVDFTYEVSRSLAACEGALLLVDASQGIEAQTLANAYLAMAHNLTIIPIINKIDLPGAEPEMVTEELETTLGIKKEEIIFTSAKEGRGMGEVLEAIVKRIPPPKGNADDKLQALIFDSRFDAYRGVIVYVRVFNGTIKPEMNIEFMGTRKKFEVQEVGSLKIDLVPSDKLTAGEVGYIIAGVKDVKDARVGDTVADANNRAEYPLPGYKPAKPMVFCGFYPVQGEDFKVLKDAIEKLQLNDAALFYEPETSAALGFGFRCGFLGLLHLEIVQERLEREFNLDLIATAPNVIYKVNMKNGKKIYVDNPTKMPSPADYDSIEEPCMKVTIFTPAEYVGNIMEICQNKRGTFLNMEYLDPKRVMLAYELPLAEVIIEFHDLLKSATRGYASMDYEIIGYQVSDLVKLDILINSEPVDALSCIIHREKAHYIGRALAKKLKKTIPRHMFQVPIQASIGSKVVAREDISAMKKNVLQKCYGGDVSRKKKLLQKQKAGKKRMKRVGRVDVPQEAFLAVLQIEK
ncbi:MAG: translation elongation factor 4 [Candidatus Margulisbacteria bacterium]|nr:translation elongation factor 4 [Candidatus Margulisiibacteriota bacterium]MBU1021445.1 translation elongation factor 4 [Candidatus Margulisiibacteriota bacterium]MBU1728366.1 translation elongation factor 4 [Candidatus Margulisiibacteriota bacterium]MBU1955891.1 translation elongation factor 4 [Candidatus Margulisiibacteriota bacterium]